MSGVIDTNVLLAAANADALQHSDAHRFLSAGLAGAEAWYLTEGIVYDFLRQATHAGLFERPLTGEQCVRFLRTLWHRDNVRILTAGSDHWAILTGVLAQLRGPAAGLMADVRTYVLMREHAVATIHTANPLFRRFDDIRVSNPLG